MDLIYFTWCLPQTLLGFIVSIVLYFRKKHIKASAYNTSIVIQLKNVKFSGVSFGKRIFVRDRASSKQLMKTINHEYGHSLQSLMLGPLYLIIIGIPSIIRAYVWKKRNLKNKDYYKEFPENWADYLGKVKR